MDEERQGPASRPQRSHRETPSSATEPVLLANLTSPQTGEALQSAELAVIPIGAHEQHGPALPVSTDTLTATALATLVGALLRPRVVVAPAIPWGVSWHHQGRPGTISLREDTLIAIILDHVDSLYRQGISRFMLLNTHGGNTASLTIAAERAKRDLGVPLVAPVFAYSLIANAARETLGSESIGHGGGDEASVIMTIRPDLVDEPRLAAARVQEDLRRTAMIVQAAGGSLPVMMHKRSASGATGDASGASREAGAEILRQAAGQLQMICEELLAIDLALL